MAKKESTIYSCQQCDHQVTKWLGRCPVCHAWNAFEGETFSSKLQKMGVIDDPDDLGPCSLSAVKSESCERVATGLEEFDRVMGGGLVKGSLILIGGEPGIGKSTLMCEIANRLAKHEISKKILYVSGEESLEQIGARAKRMGISQENIYLYHQTSWQQIQKSLLKHKPDYLIIDSIQTTISCEVSGASGSPTQIKEVTYELMNHIKRNKITCFILGHITKEGNIAGPKILEHMVDVVMSFEGDSDRHYRLLRTSKNRFGSTSETGFFSMGEQGLIEVKKPFNHFITDDNSKSYGRTFSLVNEGTRSLLVEIQALVVENKYTQGRRVTQGFDTNRLVMLVGIIEKYMEIPLTFTDIYINIVGGLKLRGQEADLSLVASLLSSYKKMPLGSDIIFLGEVGLTGEIRCALPAQPPKLKNKIVTAKQVAINLERRGITNVLGIQNVQELMNFLER